MDEPAKYLSNLSDLRVTLRCGEKAALPIQAGTSFRTSIFVTNDGDAPLKWTSDQPLNLSYRWFDRRGKCIEYDGLRTFLPAPLPEGTTKVQLEATAPKDEGDYTLVASLLLEGVHWACDVSRGGWLSIPIVIEGRTAWPRALEDSAGGKAIRGALAAASLSGILADRPIDVSATKATKCAANARHQDDSAQKSAAALPGAVGVHPKPSLMRKLRAWLRHMLGIVEMREAVEELLRRSADQELRIDSMRAELGEHFALGQKQAIAIQAQNATLEQALGIQGETVSGVTELRKLMEQAARKLRSQEASLAELHKSANDHRALMERLSKSSASNYRASNAAHEALRRELFNGKAATELLQMLGRLTEWASNAGDPRVFQSIEENVRKLPAQIREEAALVREEVGAELRQGKVAVELLSTLERLADWAHNAGDPRLLGSIDEHIRKLPAQIGGEAALIREELAAEIRQGKVAIELLSTLRQLAERADNVGDLSQVAALKHAVEQLLDRVTTEFSRQMPFLEQVERHASYNSIKLDSLLVRETLALPAAGLVLARNRLGFLAIQDDDVAAIAYYASGELPEPGTVALVERLLAPDQCFMDVGANVGAYSLLAARKVGSKGKVIAIEPLPSTTRALRTTIAINGISGIVDLHECALGAAKGQATLYAGATSGHSSMLDPAESYVRGFEVSVVRGDDLIGKYKPSLIKIDVEGWELEVVRGLEKFIAKAKQIGIIVEFSPVHVRRKGLSVKAWVGELQALGMKMWAIDEQRSALRPFEDPNLIGNAGCNLFLCRQLPAELESMLDES